MLLARNNYLNVTLDAFLLQNMRSSVLCRTVRMTVCTTIIMEKILWAMR